MLLNMFKDNIWYHIHISQGPVTFFSEKSDYFDYINAGNIIIYCLGMLSDKPWMAIANNGPVNWCLES